MHVLAVPGRDADRQCERSRDELFVPIVKGAAKFEVDVTRLGHPAVYAMALHA
jgi:hypothetical protein